MYKESCLKRVEEIFGMIKNEQEGEVLIKFSKDEIPTVTYRIYENVPITSKIYENETPKIMLFNWAGGAIAKDEIHELKTSLKKEE